MDFSDYEEGLKDAYKEGYARGWDDGYEAGYCAADSYMQNEPISAYGEDFDYAHFDKDSCRRVVE